MAQADRRAIGKHSFVVARQLLQNKECVASSFFSSLPGLGYFFLRQKQGDPSPAEAKPVATQSVAAKLTPAPRGQASEHNWMKRSLDRARDVRDQSRAQTEDEPRAQTQWRANKPDRPDIKSAIRFIRVIRGSSPAFLLS